MMDGSVRKSKWHNGETMETHVRYSVVRGGEMLTINFSDDDDKTAISKLKAEAERLGLKGVEKSPKSFPADVYV